MADRVCTPLPASPRATGRQNIQIGISLLDSSVVAGCRSAATANMASLLINGGSSLYSSACLATRNRTPKYSGKMTACPAPQQIYNESKSQNCKRSVSFSNCSVLSDCREASFFCLRSSFWRNDSNFFRSALLSSESSRCSARRQKCLLTMYPPAGDTDSLVSMDFSHASTNWGTAVARNDCGWC